MMENNSNSTLLISKQLSGTALTVCLEGRLDAITAKDLSVFLRSNLENVESLVLDMEKLSYISSAGLRSLLIAQKTMNRQGKMVLRGVNDIVMEVLHSVGFDRIMTIE